MRAETRSKHRLLLCGLGGFDKHVRGIERGLYATAGDVEVFWLNLDADELAAEFDGSNAGRAGAHEWVEDNLRFRELLYAPFHERDRLLRRVRSVPGLAHQ